MPEKPSAQASSAARFSPLASAKSACRVSIAITPRACAVSSVCVRAYRNVSVQRPWASRLRVAPIAADKSSAPQLSPASRGKVAPTYALIVSAAAAVSLTSGMILTALGFNPLRLSSS